MIQSRKAKILFLLVSIFAFIIIACSRIRSEASVCMGIAFIEPEMVNAYEQATEPFAIRFIFNDQKAAMDPANRTLYISQPADVSDPTDLVGNLQTDPSEDSYDLFFVKDEAMMSLSHSIEYNIPLTLLAVKDLVYEPWNVVITTLPVLRLEGEPFSVNEKERTVLRGELVLWAGSDPGVAAYTTKVSDVEWHIRGFSSANSDKKSYKLSLKKDGENNNCDLLGLGSDDDWILNASRLDDSKLREKLAMDLWNGHFASEPWNDPMSVSEYVEVIINDDYAGIYLLQRRIDPKYLQLDRDVDILLKGCNTWTPASIYEAYEIIDSPYTEEETYRIMEDALSRLQAQQIDMQNLVDVNLFLNCLAAVDNIGFKNTFYVLRPSDEGFQLSFVPWDTDLSLGHPLFFRNDIIYRMEFQELLETAPEIHQIAADRWMLLRQNALSEEHILSLLDKSSNAIWKSGAFRRDSYRWGLWDKNAVISVEALYDICIARLYQLDEYYSSEYAQG